MTLSISATEQFEVHRPRLRSLTVRMLGSAADADDAMQETWLRVARADATDVVNVAGWLTTIAARVCLNMLRSRSTRTAGPFDDVVSGVDRDHEDFGAPDPENEAVLAESVSLALLIVLESLDPAERLAFVLHDMFAMPFDEIAVVIDRSPAATRQLASLRGGSRAIPAGRTCPLRSCASSL